MSRGFVLAVDENTNVIAWILRSCGHAANLTLGGLRRAATGATMSQRMLGYTQMFIG